MSENEEKSDSKKWLIIGFIIVLLGINGFQYYLNMQNKEEIAEKVELIENKNIEIAQQKNSLDSMVTELEGKIAELQKLNQDYQALESLKAEIEAERNKWKNKFYSDKKSVDDLIAKIKAYEDQLVAKDEEMNKLKSQNETLFAETNTLKKEKNDLGDTITSIKVVKLELEQKVAVASILRAENVKVIAVNKKGKENADPDAEFKAKKIEKIKITFNLGDNKVAKKENKDIYMRLLEPEGSALYDANGKNTFNVNGKDIYYTDKQSVLFNNSKQALSFFYSKGAAWKPGKHTVEIYCEGEKIGEGGFLVR
jgi:hypothetical protein